MYLSVYVSLIYIMATTCGCLQGFTIIFLFVKCIPKQKPANNHSLFKKRRISAFLCFISGVLWSVDWFNISRTRCSAAGEFQQRPCCSGSSVWDNWCSKSALSRCSLLSVSKIKRCLLVIFALGFTVSLFYFIFELYES